MADDLRLRAAGASARDRGPGWAPVRKESPGPLRGDPTAQIGLGRNGPKHERREAGADRGAVSPAKMTPRGTSIPSIPGRAQHPSMP